MAEVAQLHDLYQVRFDGHIEEQECKNVLHFLCVGSTGDDDVAVHLIAVVLACFVTNLLPVLAPTYELDGITWKRVGPTLGPENFTAATGATQGASTADALPSFSSALVSIRTSRGGRSGRGRMFLAGIPEDQTTASHINTEGPFWAALAAFVQCIVTSFVGLADPMPAANKWQFGIYSRKVGGAKFPFAVTGFAPATNLVPKSLIATTRSRKIGHGS